MLRLGLIPVFTLFVAATASMSLAQPPEGPPPRPPEGPSERAEETEDCPDGPPPGGRAGGPPMGASLFVLDLDRDGVLSEEEIHEAPHALRKLDRDGDGALSAAELGERRPGPREMGRRDRGRDRRDDGAFTRRERRGPPMDGPGFGRDGFGPRGEDFRPRDFPRQPGGGAYARFDHREEGSRPEGPPDRPRPPGPPEGRGGPDGHHPPGPPHPPELGDVLPPFVRDGIALTEEQQTAITSLESETKNRLKEILTEKQVEDFGRLVEMGPPPPPDRRPRFGGGDLPSERPRRPGRPPQD